MIDFTLSQLLMRVCAVLFVSTLQGCALAAVAGALASQPEAGSQQIAQLMREARPEAFANETNQFERSVP